jgi:cytochrome c oxidase cbb3-type subunit 3
MNQNPEPNDPLLLDHNYDGIRELDNKLPRWWVLLFYGAIVFAIIYMGYYHVFGVGDLQAAQYQKEWKIGQEIKAASMVRFEKSIADMKPSTEPAILDTGRKLFAARCAPCHRADGGGLVGPNLCDDYWIHGSNFSDNITTIWNGVPAKGMITWKNFLKPDEIYSVASYIYTLRGTHPVNPKLPENQQQPAKPSVYD